MLDADMAATLLTSPYANAPIILPLKNQTIAALFRNSVKLFLFAVGKITSSDENTTQTIKRSSMGDLASELCLPLCRGAGV